MPPRRDPQDASSDAGCNLASLQKEERDKDIWRCKHFFFFSSKHMTKAARALTLLAVAIAWPLAHGAEVAATVGQISLRGSHSAHEISTDNTLQLKATRQGRSDISISDFSEDETPRCSIHYSGSSGNRDPMKCKSRPSPDVVDGRNVEFMYASRGELCKKVVLCGSWSGWKQHYNLTSDGKSETWRVTVPSIPEGVQHFKVPTALR